MDIGAEISKKIQMAITAKLKELNAYVDDELPDYIMIMVANKKTEEQMTDALSLFLSGSTKTFTSWLHALLTSLRKSKNDRKTYHAEESEVSVVMNQNIDSEDKKLSEMQKPALHPVEINTGSNAGILSATKEPAQGNAESAYSEAIITINPEQNDVFDDELLVDTYPSTEGRIDAGHSKEIIKCESDSLDKFTSGAKTCKNKDVSEQLQEKNLKRKTLDSAASKHHNQGGRRHKSSHFDEKLTIKDEKISQHPPTREWDLGKGEHQNPKPLSSKRARHGNSFNFYSDNESEDGTDKKYKSSLSSAVNQIFQESGFVSESESEGEISNAKISSCVTYPKRKMRVPLHKQANKSLFVKAVSAAEESVKRDLPAVLIRTQISPEPAKVRRKSKRSEPNAVDKPKKCARRKLSNGNDERRKLFARMASGKALYSDIIDEGRCRKPIVGPKSGRDDTAKVNVSTRKISRKEHDYVKAESVQSNRESVKFVHRSLPNENDKKQIVSHDKRKFIITTKSDSTNTPVKFDSRLTEHDSEEMSTDSRILKVPAKKQPAPTANRVTLGKDPSQAKTSEGPNFIVTLDGVVRGKNTNLESVKQENRVKQFKFQPVMASSSKKLSGKGRTKLNLTMAQGQLKRTAETSKATDVTLVELEKMRKKMLEVQKESAKLKQMQAKLVAAQAQTVLAVQSPTTGSPHLAGNEQRSIYIGNVHYSTSAKQLSDYFSICGKITRTTILTDEVTGHPKGYAYLEFEDKEAMSSALALNNTQLNHRAIRVTLKQPATTTTTYPATRALYFRAKRGRTAMAARRTSHCLSRPGHSDGIKTTVAKNRTWINPLIAQVSK